MKLAAVLVVTRSTKEIRHVAVPKLRNPQLGFKEIVEEVSNFIAKCVIGFVVLRIEPRLDATQRELRDAADVLAAAITELSEWDAGWAATLDR